MSGYLVDGSYELNVSRSVAYSEVTGTHPPQPGAFSDGQTYAAALDSFKSSVEAWDGECDPNTPSCRRFYNAVIGVAGQAKAIARNAKVSVWS